MNITNFSKLVGRLRMISDLRPNWDGYDATPPKQLVIVNARKFLQALDNENIYVDEENVYPTPYGSIIIDIVNDNEDCISIEIGHEEIGWYYEIENKIGPDNQLRTDFTKIPDKLIEDIEKLFEND